MERFLEIFVILIIGILLNIAYVRCSSLVIDNDDSEKPVLERQINSPDSQRQLEKISKLGKYPHAAYIRMQNGAIEESWTAYLDGNDVALMAIINRDGFNPNVVVDGINTLLQAAVLKNDPDLVNMVISLPGIDLGYTEINISEPIDMAVDKPDIQRILLDAIERSQSSET